MVAAVGSRETIASPTQRVAIEVDDPELLSVPVEGVDVYVTNKEVDGKTLAELAELPNARGVFLRKITRGAVATSIPILPNTKIFRGDIVTVAGRTQDTNAAVKILGVPDRRPTSLTSRLLAPGSQWERSSARWSGSIRCALTLSTAGGALISD